MNAPFGDRLTDAPGTGGAGEVASRIPLVAPPGQNVTACPHHGCEGGTATVDDGGSGMTDHNGVLMMQRALLAGTLGLAMARKAAAILEGDPRGGPGAHGPGDQRSQGDRSKDGAGLRAIRDAPDERL